MFVKKLIPYLSLLLLLVASTGYSQVVTSKKEAVKKGIYQKPAEPKSETKKPAPEVKATVAALLPTDKPKPVAANTTVDKKAKTTKTVKSKKNLIVETEDPDLFPAAPENYLAMQMINNAMSFIGVKYHGGGTTTAGMDCSGMVTAVFNIFDMKLPRSSNEMARVGKKLDIKDIQKGDLVFFRTNGKSIINHVGMVVEVIGDEIKFVHSSTQKGVIVSSTKEPYYSRTFAQANRVYNRE